MRNLYILAILISALFLAWTPTNATSADTSYSVAKAGACPDCNGAGKASCSFCKGKDLTKQVCAYCKGKDLTKSTCSYCKGRDLTKLKCTYCKGRDLTKLNCNYCRGSGNVRGSTCALCRGSGKQNVCALCRGSGKQNTCALCRGAGNSNTCALCRGSGHKAPCVYCKGRAANKSSCTLCSGTGTAHVVLAKVPRGTSTYTTNTGPQLNVAFYKQSTNELKLNKSGYPVAENGSYYGQKSKKSGRLKTVYVNGYYRKDGTYVRSHYRALPSSSGNSLRAPPAQFKPFIAENGSYYGQPNQYGVPKTVHVRGYYRKDGTYVRGHYRSRPTRTK